MSHRTLIQACFDASKYQCILMLCQLVAFDLTDTHRPESHLITGQSARFVGKNIAHLAQLFYDVGLGYVGVSVGLILLVSDHARITHDVDALH